MKHKILHILYLLRTLPQLGYWNFGYTVWYKLSLRMGSRKRYFPMQPPIEGEFFKPQPPKEDYPTSWRTALEEQLRKLMQGRFTWFSYHEFQVGEIPDWFANPFNDSKLNNPQKHWTELSDFDLNTGDVKILWELSRFDWLTDLARGYRVIGDAAILHRINALLNDWSSHNPMNVGPNWKCGQETAIRMMKLLTADYILGGQASDALQKMVYQHVCRIEPNMNYAIAQDNNHGTSEAAGLYIGAAWLLHKGWDNPELLQFKKKGRAILEERILRLIQKDGTFAQRSMTYHRVAVDTMAWVAYQMEVLQEPSFSSAIQLRLEKLATWQYKMTLGKDGDAPNFGSNDGARLENLYQGSYRDFRHSTQFLVGCLLKKQVYGAEFSESLYWRYGKKSLEWERYLIEIPTYELLDQQMLILRKGEAVLMLKVPEATFRPGNDAFHVDLWYKGENILRDNGSYSYNAGKETDWYKSVAAHNTIQFGSHEQMPKLTRFLNGLWIKPDKIGEIEHHDSKLLWEGTYTDYKGNRHTRVVELSDSEAIIKDEVATQEQATIRYHFNMDVLENSNFEFQCSLENWKYEDTATSMYYLEKTTKQAIVAVMANKAEFRVNFKVSK